MACGLVGARAIIWTRWNTVNLTLLHKIQWNIYRNSYIFKCIWKCIWICCLRNVGHFVLISMCNVEQRSGVGVTKPISSVQLFSEIFNIVKTHIMYSISCLYLASVAAAQLRWHLPNMNVIQKPNRYFCDIEIFAYGGINEQSFSNPPP